MPFYGLQDPAMDKFAQSIWRAGEHLQTLDRTPIVKQGEGHRSIIAQDKVSQSMILTDFADQPSVRFVSEEDSDDPRVLSRADPSLIFTGKVIVVDPLDGTTRYSAFFPEWCVGGAIMKDGVVIGSAAYAPDANGGLALHSYGGYGGEMLTLQVTERGLSINPNLFMGLPEREEKSQVILRGVDTELYLNITTMMPRIASRVRGVYITGSGIFGLMNVVMGRAAAIIQTPQKVWGWLPMYHAMLTAGKVFRFFRLKDGDLIPVETFDEAAFGLDPTQRLGFVAGEKNVAEKIFAMLPPRNWERFNPDTI